MDAMPSTDFETHILPILTSKAFRGLCLKWTRNDADADDLVATTMERAWRYRESLKVITVRVWVTTIARNAWTNEIHRRSSQVHRRMRASWDPTSEAAHIQIARGAPEEDAPTEIADPNVPDHASAIDQRAADAVATLEIAALPHAYRKVVRMRIIDEMTVRETARELGIPEGTVMSRTKRGLDILRAA